MQFFHSREEPEVKQEGKEIGGGVRNTEGLNLAWVTC